MAAAAEFSAATEPAATLPDPAPDLGDREAVRASLPGLEPTDRPQLLGEISAADGGQGHNA